MLIAIGLSGGVLTVKAYRDLKRQSALMSEFAKEVAGKGSKDASRTQALLDLQRAANEQAEVASSWGVRVGCIVSAGIGFVTLASGIGLLASVRFFSGLAIVCAVAGLLWGIYAHQAREELRAKLREQIRTFYTSVEQTTGVQLNWEERLGWKRADHPVAAIVGSAFALLIQVCVLVGLIHIWRVESTSGNSRQGRESTADI